MSQFRYANDGPVIIVTTSNVFISERHFEIDDQNVSTTEPICWFVQSNFVFDGSFIMNK